MTLVNFRHIFSLQVYAASFQWRLVIFIGRNLWRRVLEANKKQVRLKSYSLKIRINSVNQNIVEQRSYINPQHKYTNQNYRLKDSVCIFCVYQIIKNRGPGLYNSLCHGADRKYFRSVSLSLSLSLSLWDFTLNKVFTILALPVLLKNLGGLSLFYNLSLARGMKCITKSTPTLSLIDER